MLESALVVPIPEAERLVGELRAVHDPSARLGVPAHITLLYPFAEPAVAVAHSDALAELFAEVSPFDFSLVEVRRFPGTAYLHPDKSELFEGMTQAIAGRWPEYPPFAGRFPEVIPHLTVADRAGADVLDRVERALEPHLPVRCHASQAWLMTSDASGMWTKAAYFTFALAFRRSAQ